MGMCLYACFNHREVGSHHTLDSMHSVELQSMLAESMRPRVEALRKCLEGLFDTWGVFGRGFNNNLTLGAPTPIGAGQAKLSQEMASHLAEVALNEQVRPLSTSARSNMLMQAFMLSLGLLVHKRWLSLVIKE